MNMVACAMRATNSPTASLLMLRVMYWNDKARVQRDNKTWIVKSAADWMEETGLSLQQYKDALKKLKTLGLIDVTVHLFQNVRTTFLRLSESGQKCLQTLFTKVPKDPFASGSKDTLPVTESLNSEIEQGEHVVADNAGEYVSKKKPESKNTTKPNPYKGLTTAQMVEKMKEAKLGNPSGILVKDGFDPPEIVWKQAVAIKTGEFVPSLTGMEVGQLRHFVKKCPKGKANEIIKTVVAKWDQFVIYVKDETPAKGVWNTPNIGMVLKFAQQAIKVYDLSKDGGKPALQLIAKKKKPSFFQDWEAKNGN